MANGLLHPYKFMPNLSDVLKGLKSAVSAGSESKAEAKSDACPTCGKPLEKKLDEYSPNSQNSVAGQNEEIARRANLGIK